jgi:DNA-binding CsgD family transcriptional regulator
MAELELVGRESELAELEGLLDRCARSSRAMQIEGAAGMGKTALWREGLARAHRRSYRVLTARPVETETKLSFAGLTDLLEPVIDDVLPELPEPQRRSFEVALLLAPGRVRPDPRGVAAAFLNALRVLSRDRPVLVGVDDLQWLDSSSHQAVAFAARRLGPESVGFLVTRRAAEGDGSAPELEQALPEEWLRKVQLGPLSVTALHHLVEADLGNAVPRPLLRRIYDVSEGNPFFALEQARALRQAGLTLGTGHELPVPGTLRSLVQGRLARIPQGEREALLAVAALAAPTRELLVSFAGALDNGWPPLMSAFESKIVEVTDGVVRFTHPLLRSILYADTPLPVRQDVHRRLAEIVGDPEESARHLALSVDGPDEAIAVQLEAASLVASARGAPSSAGELLELAIGMTSPADRSTLRERHVHAGRQWAAAGDTSRAIALLEVAVSISEPGCARAASVVELGGAVGSSGNWRAAAALYSGVLEEPCDEARVRISLEKGLGWIRHMLGDVCAAERHAHAAVALAETLGEQAVLAETLADLALIQMLRGREDYRATMDRALALGPGGQYGVPADDTALAYWWLPAWQNALLLTWAGELDDAQECLEALHRLAAERGDEQTLPFALACLSKIAFHKDDWAAAAAYADEAYDASVSAPGERVFTLVPKALVEAHRGNVQAAREAGEEGFRLAEMTGIVSARIDHQAVQGSLALSLGDLDAAHRFLASLPDDLERHGFAEPAVFRFHPDLVETLVARGEIAEAEEQLAVLEACGERLPSSWALAGAARCRGLLHAAGGDETGAFAQFESALAEHDRAGERFERARTLLVYGVALRRARRKRAAREALDEAAAIFDGLGAVVWSERARGESTRVSGAAPRSGGLTETEHRIMDLATAGRSNKQIAAELHVTVRTVESNLTRIYRKLGVSSRAQLTQLVRQ